MSTKSHPKNVHEMTPKKRTSREHVSTRSHPLWPKCLPPDISMFHFANPLASHQYHKVRAQYHLGFVAKAVLHPYLSHLVTRMSLNRDCTATVLSCYLLNSLTCKNRSKSYKLYFYLLQPLCTTMWLALSHYHFQSTAYVPCKF